jgi:hypothetical protein
MPSVASQADAMTKVAAVVPDFAGTRAFFEQLGFDSDFIGRAMSQMQANANRRNMAALLASRQQPAQAQQPQPSEVE